MAVQFAEVNDTALAAWPQLLARWLPDGKRVGNEWVARNPTRNDRKPGSFLINCRSGKWLDHATSDRGGDPISLYQYLEGLPDALSAAKQLAQELGLSDDGERYRKTRESLGVRPKSPPTDEARERAKRIGVAHKIWSMRRPAAGTLVEKYLAYRGVYQLPKTVTYGELYHQALAKGATCPAMLSMIVDVHGSLTGVHKVYLQEPGRKADIDPPKVMNGVALGSSVRLSARSPNLLIGEGVESSLSLLQLCPDWTVWAALSANGIAALAIPEWARTVVVVADHDSKFDIKTKGLHQAGLSAANKMLKACELQGLQTALVSLPRGLDPNDFLTARSDLHGRFQSYMAGLFQS